MKREQKSLTNKGFSLVELIIVVAIMAVLIGVLAPQYLRYVEKTKLQKDNSAIAEVANVIKIAGAEEEVVAELKSGAIEYTFKDSGIERGGTVLSDTVDASTKPLDKEIIMTIKPSDVKLTSTAYTTAADKPILTVEIDPNTSIISVTATHWIEKPGAKPTTDADPKKF